MGGWIKFHRKILDNELWHDVTTFRLFTLLLLRASHKDGLKVKGVEINRGQYLRSYSKLAEDLEFKEGRGYKKVSKSTIKRSVQKLIEEGMVTVHETDSGTVFTIAKYLDYQGVDEHDENTNRTDNGTLVERTQNEGGTNPEQEQELKNLRIKELKDSTTTADAIVFFQQNIGVISPHISEEMLGWINDLSDEMVIEALGRSLDRNKPSWGYAKSILQSWAHKGIKTIEQAKAEEVQFKNQQQAKKPFYPKQQVRQVPSWINNEQEQPDPPQQQSSIDVGKEKAELLEFIQQNSKRRHS